MSGCLPIPPHAGAVDLTVLPDRLSDAPDDPLLAPCRRRSGSAWAVARHSTVLHRPPQPLGSTAKTLFSDMVLLSRSTTAAKQTPFKTRARAAV
jgi:hypothetical protein